MKVLSSLVFVLGCFLFSAAIAHQTKQVKQEMDAFKKLLPEHFMPFIEGAAWQKLNEEALKSFPKIKEFQYARLEAKAPGQSIYIGRFTAQADFGPLTAITAIQSNQVLGIEILTFTEHEGDMVSKPAFLDQFKGLSILGLEKASLKAIPKEPLALDALQEGLLSLSKIYQAQERPVEEDHSGHNH